MQSSFQIPSIDVSVADKASLAKQIADTIPQYEPQRYARFAEACEKAARSLPPPFLQWRDAVRATGLGLIRDLPIDDTIPPTPLVRHAADSISLAADSVVGVVASLFGALYTFGAKTTSRHIHNVYPIAADAETQLGSSKNELEWHVEDGFHPARPDWVILFCLRSDPLATTRLARVADFRLPELNVKRLKEQCFYLRIDDSFESNTHSLYVATAVLSGNDERREIVFDPAYTRRDDPGVAQELALVRAEAERVQIRVTLGVGELLVFNNRRLVHARTAYRPRMDGSDRWLKRALVLENEEWRKFLKEGAMPFIVLQ